MTQRTMSVTTSAMKSFMSCRRRYFFEYVEKIKPLQAPRPLSFGSGVHAGIEAVLTGTDVDNKVAKSYIERGNEAEAGPWPRIAAIAAKAFDKHVDWRAWQIDSVEKTFEVSCGYAKRLLGKFDAIAFVNGKRVLLEHKTASLSGESEAERYKYRLFFDDQASAYLFAMDAMGIEVAGILYNVMCKPDLKQHKATPLSDRKYTTKASKLADGTIRPAGSLYAGQRENDETDDEFVARVEAWYDEPGRFFQHLVYRTPAQTSAAREKFRAIMRDMQAAEKDQTFYANPRACEIFPCPYECLCLEDTPEARSMNFVAKQATNEELTPVSVDGETAVNF